MDITLLKQKVNEWKKACEYFARPDIQELLSNEEKSAIKFLMEHWETGEFNKTVCEKHINTLKGCDKLHSSNRDIIEKSKTFRGIAATFYTKDAESFNAFRTEMGWKPTPKNTPTPTPTPTPNHQHNDAMMMLNIEKWSKAIQFLRSETITPLLEVNEHTAIEQLADMWRRPLFKPEMKEEAAELVKVLIDSHKLHSSNREIIEHSKNLCGVARKVYDNKESFEAFKKAITQFYKENKPPKKDPVPKRDTPKKETPTPIKHDKELILTDVIFANTTYEHKIIKDFGKTLYSDTQYITPRLIVASDYHGIETIEIKLRYPNGETASYEDEIEFNGKGKYDIAGWGSKSGTSYSTYQYVEYTFICRGKKLWQGRVNFTQDPNKAQYPHIVDIKFGATDYNGNIVVEHGLPIPTGIPYLSPMIVVDNNFRGEITLDIEYRFDKRNTNKTDSTISINGPGEYTLSGWGRSDCTFYSDPETVTCIISYKGKQLYSKSVKIGSGGNRRRKTSTSNHNGESLWNRFKYKIEEIGEWFDDKTEDPESVSIIFTSIAFILYIVAIIVYWVTEGFWAALIGGVIGFFVTGLIILAINYVTKIALYILRYIFLNVWTFLIAAIILLSQVILPIASNGLKGLFSSNDANEQVEVYQSETTTYICTAQSGVKVRTAPSTEASQVGALLYNQQVEVYEIEGDFARIDYNGSEAWVSSKYISIDTNAYFWNLRQGNGVKILGDGIYYKVLKKGKGDKPQSSSTVKCTYELSLPDGTIIENTGDEAVKFKLDEVINGLSIALQDMKKGERRRVFIPPHFAYGDKQTGNIPANSILIFDIKLVEIVEEVEEADSQLLFTDLNITQEDGSIVSLSDYVGHGRYVLVDFWASWAGPCRKSLPHLINFYRGHSRSLDMLGIAVWDKPQDSRNMIEEYQIPYPQILNAQQEHTKLYGIDAVPHLILFAPDGRIVMQGQPDEEFLMQVKDIIYKQ